MRFINQYIGMRTFKTALAVALCILISHLSNTNYPIFACIAAICSMNPTVNGIFKTVKEQLIGTSFGVVVGTVFTLSIPDTIYTRVPTFFAGVIIVILFCNKMNFNVAIQLACIVFIDVYLFGGASPNGVYGLNRLFDTSWGLLVAVFVNLAFKPYNHRPEILDVFRNTQRTFKALLSFRVFEGGYPDLDLLRHNLHKLESNLREYENQGIKKRKQHREDYIYLKGCEQLLVKMADEMISLCNMDYVSIPSAKNVNRLRQYGLYIPPKFEDFEELNDENSIVFNFHLTNLLDADYFLTDLMKNLK